MPNKRVSVEVNPAMLRWAMERARLSVASLQKMFPRLGAWLAGEVRPTLKQLERFAAKTHVPIGYLFLAEPPDERLPIPDFRTTSGAIERPSPQLLETIYICQQRQEWYREYLQTTGQKPLSFVGSVSLQDNPIQIAAQIRSTLRLDLDERRQLRTWTEALQRLIEQSEQAGVLVMASSVVGNDPRRKLDIAEFRGFALVDDLAPVIFINMADSKSAQMFTVVHELVHVWLGVSGVSDVNVKSISIDEKTEQWCNQVAAEALVPAQALLSEYVPQNTLRQEVKRLARVFKVSTLVVLRRLYDIGRLDRETFWANYQAEVERVIKIERRNIGGGDFYRTLNTRVSRPFARALVISTLEGYTLFRDAYRLLCIRKPETFRELAKALVSHQELGDLGAL